MPYEERTYRKFFSKQDMIHFEVAYKETDLDIGISKKDFKPELIKKAKSLIVYYRQQLEDYIKKDPVFARTLEPHNILLDAPPIAKEMAKAAKQAGVGPMAAVAGAMAQFVANDLVDSEIEIIIENGGDIYMNTHRTRHIGIFAGESPFSNKIALKIEPSDSPLGICTSSGNVGPSISLGKADASVILSKSAILADAVATAIGNYVKVPSDVEKAAELATKIPGIKGAIIIAGDKLAAWGEVELVDCKP
ncbi:MAG: uncharacterized protein PWP31_1350 [Clostridia bacterium]|nr:uncharacterized protein [Clostridia bacterium]